MVPEGWEEGRVGDLLEKLESGVSVNGEDRPLQPGEFGVLRVSSVTYGTFKPSAAKDIVPKDTVVFNPVVQNTAFKQHIYSVQLPATLQG